MSDFRVSATRWSETRAALTLEHLKCEAVMGLPDQVDPDEIQKLMDEHEC